MDAGDPAPTEESSMDDDEQSDPAGNDSPVVDSDDEPGADSGTTAADDQTPTDGTDAPEGSPDDEVADDAADDGAEPDAGADDEGDARDWLPPYQLAVNGGGVCAIQTNGELLCWAVTVDGDQLEIPEGTFDGVVSWDKLFCAWSDGESPACFVLPGATYGVREYMPEFGITQLSISNAAVCGVDADGVSFCRTNDDLLPEDSPNRAGRLVHPMGVSFAQISAGRFVACGLRDQGEVYCFGEDGSDYDECSINAPVGQLEAPQETFMQLSTSELTTCGVTTSGSILCWGSGTSESDANPSCDTQIHHGQGIAPSQGEFHQVDVGTYGSCAVQGSGELACWGSLNIECANLDECDRTVPPEGAFDQVSVGEFQTCAMKSDRSLVCWGAPYDGFYSP
jgi:hypothetical protein